MWFHTNSTVISSIMILLMKRTISIAALIFSLSAIVLRAQPPSARDARGRARSSTAIDISSEYIPCDAFCSRNYLLGIRDTRRLSGDITLMNTLRGEYRKTEHDVLFPQDLYRIRYMFRFDVQSIRFGGGIASSSDEPFESNNEIEYMAHVEFKVYENVKSSLYIGLLYSSKQIFYRDYYLPFPFFTYIYRDRTLFLSIGIPFMVRWMMTERAFFHFTYFPVYNISTDIGYRFFGFLSTSINMTWRQEKYLLADRENEDEKFFYDRKTVGLKVKPSFGRHFGVFLLCGYQFDGSYYYGEQFSDRRDENRIKSSPIVQFGINAMF